MTHTSRNQNACAPASLNVCAAVTLVLLGLAGWLASGTVRARDDSPGPLLSPPSQTSIKKDLATAIQVRKALSRDEKLAPRKLNLSVNVTSGIARLSGPVPSEEVRKRVIRVVTDVPGVLQVQSAELYLAKPQEELKLLVLPSEADKPTRTQSASPNPASAALGTLTGREPSAATPPCITLRAPEAVPSAPPNPGVLTAQPRAPSPPTSLSTAIDDLRQRDARFRAIRVEMQGNVLCVFAGNADGESVMALAQALTRLPGVERVVVRDSSSIPR